MPMFCNQFQTKNGERLLCHFVHQENNLGIIENRQIAVDLLKICRCKPEWLHMYRIVYVTVEFRPKSPPPWVPLVHNPIHSFAPFCHARGLLLFCGCFGVGSLLMCLASLYCSPNDACRVVHSCDVCFLPVRLQLQFRCLQLFLKLFSIERALH